MASSSQPEPRVVGLPSAAAIAGSTPAAGLAAAVLLATTLLVCLSASRSELLLPTSLRPLPAWLAGPFEGGGVELGLAALIAAFAVMLVSYAVAARGAHQLSGRTVLACVLAFHAVVLLAPPLFSSDVFSYTAYARIGTVFGANPYTHGPAAFPMEALHSLIGARWIGTPTVYGPVFTALSYLLAPLGIAAEVLAYKALAAVSSLILTLITWRAARLRGLEPSRAAVLVGLNPVIVLYGVGGGHNDLLMLAILGVGLYLVLRRGERGGGALLVTAAAVKLTAGLLLPFAFADRRRRVDGLASRRLVVGAGLAATAIGVLGYLFFGTGPLHIIATLRGIQAEGHEHSIVGFLLTASGLPGLAQPVALLLTAVFAAILVWLLRRVWIGELDWITGAGWATVALLCTSGFLVPWYVTWLIPLAALSGDHRLRGAAILLTGVGLTTL